MTRPRMTGTLIVVMRPILGFLRSSRAFAALLLLATLVVGEVADARHHLAETGCATEHTQGPQRDDCCACTSLHVAPLASPGPVLAAPVVVETRVSMAPRLRHEGVCVAGADAPRGPPRV